MSMKRNSAMAMGVVLALFLGNALVGVNPVGYHVECTDGIDNNQDGFIDGDDPSCSEYPWADGNGEAGTPVESQGYYSSSSGYRLYSNYLVEYSFDIEMVNNQLCFITSIEDVYHDEDVERAEELVIERDINCGLSGTP